MKRKVAVVAASSIVLIFLPITALGLLLSINEYRDQGITGAVDCNGPLSVMMFMAPSLVVYTAGVVFYAILLNKQRRSVLAAGLLVLCLLMLIVSGGKAYAAYREKSRPEHRETCGEGW
jgi:hypothetical protein